MEWRIDHFEFSEKQFDFEESGQSKEQLTQLTADNCIVFNMLERTCSRGSQMQLLLCETCGIDGCESGGWLSPRTYSDRVILIPVSGQDNDFDSNDQFHSAPAYIHTRGTPSFSIDNWENIRSKSNYIASVDEISLLNQRELILMIQYFAPGHILGRAGREPSLDVENVLAVTDGDLDEELYNFTELICASLQSNLQINQLIPERIVEFHLDIAGFASWRPFGYSAGKPVLNANCVLG